MNERFTFLQKSACTHLVPAVVVDPWRCFISSRWHSETSVATFIYSLLAGEKRQSANHWRCRSFFFFVEKMKSISFEKVHENHVFDSCQLPTCTGRAEWIDCSGVGTRLPGSCALFGIPARKSFQDWQLQKYKSSCIALLSICFIFFLNGTSTILWQYKRWS